MIRSTTQTRYNPQAAQSTAPKVWDKIFDLNITNEEAEDETLGQFISNINYRMRTGVETLDDPSLKKSFDALVDQLQFIRRVAQEEKAELAAANKSRNKTTAAAATVYAKRRPAQATRDNESGNESITNTRAETAVVESRAPATLKMDAIASAVAGLFGVGDPGQVSRQELQRFQDQL